MCRRKKKVAEERPHRPPPSPATYHRLKELRKTHPKVVWVASHRDTWLAILALFSQLVPLCYVCVSGIYIWFVYAPFNDEFIRQIKDELGYFRDIKLEAEERLQTIFTVPIVAGLTSIFIIIIHMISIFYRRVKYKTMLANQMVCLIWSAIIAVWFVLISNDLEKWPDDHFGLVDPLIKAYEYLLNDDNSEWQITLLSQVYECCGLNGPADYFTDSKRIKSNYPKIVGNEIHVVPQSCCIKNETMCHIQKPGQLTISMVGMRKMGCRQAIHNPLMVQTRAAGIVAFLGFLLEILITYVLYELVTTMKRKRVLYEMRKTKTNEYIRAELQKTEEEYYRL